MMRFLITALCLTVLMASVIASASAQTRAGYALLDQADFGGLDNYLWPEWTTMKANVIKFQMSYSVDWANGNPTFYRFKEWQIQKAIDAQYAGGAGTQAIIFRGPDYHTTAANTQHFLGNMRFPDTWRRIVDFVWDYKTVNPAVKFYLEVGNEPNFGLSASVARDRLIDTWLYCRPNWTFLDNMTWIASVPSQDASDSYFSTFFATGLGGHKVQNLYPLLGAHAYGTMNSADNPNNCYLNTKAMDKAIDSTGATKKRIFVTECNFNGNKDWGNKGSRLKYYFQSWGRKQYVDGWVYWASTTDPFWNSWHPAPDGPFYYGIDRYYEGGGTIPSLPFANQLRTR